jgi:transcription elongation factor S-II
MGTMYVIHDPNQFRCNIVTILENIFIHSNLSSSLSYYITQNIEKSIYNYTIKESVVKKTIKKWENPIFVHIYIDKLRSIFMNLKNTMILHKIITFEIMPQNIAFMTHQELNPENWKILLDLKYKRDESKFNVIIQPSTDVYVCRKCKSRKCTYSAQQTRSSDEPMTIYVSCLNCGKNWAC